MKKIKENEFFQVGETIFQYVIQEGKHKLLPVKKVVKKEVKYPSLQEVKDYFESKGYDHKSATKFYDYYTAGEWKDGNGKQVKNWKQKATGVWFKPENLIKKESQPQEGISFFNP